MLTVEDYGQLRRAHRDGMSIREIARTFHHSRRKVREALASPEPEPYTRAKDPPAPKLGAFHATIEAILEADEQAPRKQRHTAAQIFRRLRDEHEYAGGYDQVRRYVGRHRREQRETFIPLTHDPGQRLECDFGHIYADFPNGRRQVPVLMPTWAYSNPAGFAYCPFAVALPTERVEAILHGMVEAFAFFGCVPREVWWDNPKTVDPRWDRVVIRIFKGRRRTLHERYAALASHYTFEPLCCMPARGNEKPHTENRVFDLQRRWATPVPYVRDLAELNTYLRTCCLKDRERTVAGQTETVGQRFLRDRAAALPLPEHAFDPCVPQPAVVDKYQTVHFDTNRYSVPRNRAFRPVTVKAYVDHIEIVTDGQITARHDRCYERGQQILDPIHYLVTLERRPAALDHAGVYRNWRLPAAFTRLRETLEQRTQQGSRHGTAAGARQYIRVLQLLATHPVARVEQAIANGDLDAELIRLRVERLGRRPDPPDPTTVPDALVPIQVPPEDLSRFDAYLTQGELTHV